MHLPRCPPVFGSPLSGGSELQVLSLSGPLSTLLWLRPQLPTTTVFSFFLLGGSSFCLPVHLAYTDSLVTSMSPAVTFDPSTLVLREWPAPTNSCTHWFGLTGGPGRRSEKELRLGSDFLLLPLCVWAEGMTVSGGSASGFQ